MGNTNSPWETEGISPGQPARDPAWEDQRHRLINITHQAIDNGFTLAETKQFSLDWNRAQKQPFPDWDVLGVDRWCWRKFAQGQSSPDQGGEKPPQLEAPNQGNSMWYTYESLLNTIRPLIETGMAYDKILSIAETWNTMAENPPFSKADCQAVAKWGWDTWGPGNPHDKLILSTVDERHE